jgi:hypothetical protein
MTGYRFLPWVRTGLATGLGTRDTLAAGVPGRAEIGVRLAVGRSAGAPLTVEQRVRLLGPGDVVGLDPRQVIRTDPAPFATDHEPNLLASVELDAPELPWLFTPAAADQAGRLRPWLVLVVLARGAGVALGPPRAGAPAELVLTDGAAAQLPDLTDSWAWAHAQVLLLDGEQVPDVLAQAPQRTAARLLCPRRLDPATRYLACVVPAFEAGRLAGLGLDRDPADDELRPAWAPGVDELRLPVYHSWEFATGVGGDFESLARALRPRPLPASIGEQPIDMDDPGAPLPPETGVAVGGALVPPGWAPAPWPPATVRAVRTGLRGVLDAPARRVGAAGGGAVADAPPLGPPIYGGRAAGRSTVPADGAQPAWLAELNLDPRLRAVAGLGARIVLAEQERLMDQAWAQVGEIEAANRELRRAQAARWVRGSLLRRHLAPLPADQRLGVTAPAHRRVLAGDRSVAAAVTASAVPGAVLSPAFRRVSGPRAALARRLDPAGPRRPRALVDGVDSGRLRPTAPQRAPDGLFDLQRSAPARTDAAPDVVAALRAAREEARTRRPQPLDARQVETVELTAALTQRIAAALGLPGGAAGADGVRRFRTAAAVAARRAERLAGTPDPVRPQLSVGPLAAGLLTRLDPARTVGARLRTRLRVPPELVPRSGRDPAEEILAAPVFDRPVWELLAAHAPALLLPGLDRVPQDTATLAETNPAFLAAALVGLNHEMGRELLWREFPTDQRGTCFRRFWAPGGADDIPPVHTWTAGGLASHVAGDPDGQLVLLLRGRLLARYPATVVYAAPDRSGRPDLRPNRVVMPLFGGGLPPDVAFRGFGLTVDQARSQGWWFVLEEQPTEPRFGLDVATRYGPDAGPLREWGDLSWGHLAADADELAGITHLRTDRPPRTAQPASGPRWGATAAAMAAILLQQPVRVALRAADLLPAGAPA